MRQTRKGNQWSFGTKAHFGVDSRLKLIHAVAASPANVADSRVLPELLHGRETRVWGDQTYRGQRAVIRQCAPRTRLHQPPLSPSRRRGRSRAGEEPHQIEGASQGRASHRGHQTGVRLRQGALPRAPEKPASPARDRGAGQSVHGPPPALARRSGVMRPHRAGQPRDARMRSDKPHLPPGLVPIAAICMLPSRAIPPYADLP